MKSNFLTSVFILSTMALGLIASNNADAAFISTQEVEKSVRTELNRDQILQAFARQDVQKILVAKGVDLTKANERIKAMTDTEIASLHQNIDELPAGAGAGSVLVTVVLVLVVLDILGITNIFTFIR